MLLLEVVTESLSGEMGERGRKCMFGVLVLLCLGYGDKAYIADARAPYDWKRPVG